jgi:hypothetical protein
MSMRDKYIEELVGTFYLFPEGHVYSDVAISSTGNDVASAVETQQAKALVLDRNRLFKALAYAINQNDEPYEVFLEIRNRFYQ